MTTAAPRPFIAAMQVTLDGYSLGPDGAADWVDSWADALDLLPRVDAFVLGAGMFSGYEAFWAAVRKEPAAVAEWLGRDPYPREIEYAALRAFKAQPGGAVYVVGGASLVRSLIDAELLDELRLIVHPVAVGAGAGLFDGIARRQDLQLVDSEPTTAGRITLTYRLAASTLAHAH